MPENTDWLQLQGYICAWREQNGYNSSGIYVPGEYRIVTTPGVYLCLERTEWLQLQRYISAWRIQNDYNSRGIFVPGAYKMVTTPAVFIMPGEYRVVTTPEVHSCLENTEWLQLRMLTIQRYIREWRLKNS